jgi:methylmalonyl-CoA epimerase
VGRFLAKRGPGMHHVAYEVEDIRAALAHLSDAGAELIDETPRHGMFGLEVAFVHPDSVHGVLTEVVAVG